MVNGKRAIGWIGLFVALIGPTPAVRAAFEPPVLRVSLETEPGTVEWNQATGEVDRFLVSFMTQSLLKYAEDGTLVCNLCTKLVIEPQSGSLNSNHQIKMEFANPVLWSDSRQLSVGEILAGIERGRKTLGTTLNRWAAKAIMATGGASKNWITLQLQGQGLLPLHYFTTPLFAPYKKGAVLGPYELAAWEKGKRIVFEGNPNYVGARPVYRVEFLLGNHALQLKSFKNGKIDILARPTTDDVLGAKNERVQVNTVFATRFLAINSKSKVLAKPEARRAIAFRLDRTTLPELLKTGERPATTLAPPGLQGHAEKAVLPFDIRLSDGEVKKVPELQGGSANKVSLLVQKGGTGEETLISKWIKGSLERFAALQVSVVEVSPKEFWKHWQAQTEDMALLTWSFSISSIEELTRQFGQNSTGSLENDATLIPLTYPAQSYLLGSRVENFMTTPQGYPDLIKIRLKQ